MKPIIYKKFLWILAAVSFIVFIFAKTSVAQNKPLPEPLTLSEAIQIAAEQNPEVKAARFRPMMLTAAAVVVGASVILFDPIFQGLAISLMAGEVASLLFSRMTVPILYFLDKRWEFAHKQGVLS